MKILTLPLLFTGLIVLVAFSPSYSRAQKPANKIIGKDSAPMVLVPAGEFTMGSDDGDADEKPAHRVYLDDYYIDKYEVTTSRYAAFLRETGRAKPQYWNRISLVSDGDRPVVGVDWNDADAYCRYYGKRLPTEAEWEKAARGTDGRVYPWGNGNPTRRLASFDQSRWSEMGYALLAPVKSHDGGKSPYGVYHMAGNVWEWVADWYANSYYQNSPSQNPTGPSSGSFRVVRGGYWGSSPQALRSASRYYGIDPTDRNNGLGFRCLKTP
jgi:formylglycine-generating enzyme required for sulfatase activity